MTYLKHIILARTDGLLANIQILVPIFASLAFLRVLILTLALSTLTFGSAQAGGQGSGGGDPLIRYAVPYPDTDKLQQALQLVETQVLKSGYPDDFKGQLVVEMHVLLKAEKYRMLPALIILGPGAGPEGYQPPQDDNDFIDLGGMTKLEKGANIYLAERVRQYSNEQLSALLLHELIHHCLNYVLSDDEKFVEDLTASIMSGVRTHKLDLAFETKTYFRKDFISRDQMLEAMGLDFSMQKKILAAISQIPKNLNDFEAASTSGYFSPRIYNIVFMIARLFGRYNYDYTYYRAQDEDIWDKITTLSEKLNPAFSDSIKNKPGFEKPKYPSQTRAAWKCQNPEEQKLVQGPADLLVLPFAVPIYLLNSLFGYPTSTYICNGNDYFYTLDDLFIPADERK